MTGYRAEARIGRLCRNPCPCMGQTHLVRNYARPCRVFALSGVCRSPAWPQCLLSSLTHSDGWRNLAVRSVMALRSQNMFRALGTSLILITLGLALLLHASPADAMVSCPLCKGTGVLVTTKQMGKVTATGERVCPRCKGHKVVAPPAKHVPKKPANKPPPSTAGMHPALKEKFDFWKETYSDCKSGAIKYESFIRCASAELKKLPNSDYIYDYPAKKKWRSLRGWPAYSANVQFMLKEARSQIAARQKKVREKKEVATKEKAEREKAWEGAPPAARSQWFAPANATHEQILADIAEVKRRYHQEEKKNADLVKAYEDVTPRVARLEKVLFEPDKYDRSLLISTVQIVGTMPPKAVAVHPLGFSEDQLFPCTGEACKKAERALRIKGLHGVITITYVVQDGEVTVIDIGLP